MKIYELGLHFDLTDVKLYKLKDETKWKDLKFLEHVKTIFNQLDDFITWGSFGIIVGDPKEGAKEPPYVWSTEVIDISINENLNTFLNEVKSNRHSFLVLAQLGEELHQNGASVPCLVMTKEDITVELDGVRVSKWDKSTTESLNELSDRIDLSNYLARWQNYHLKVKKVTASHQNSICYIPAVCRRDSSENKVLGGGLVLCVKQGKLTQIFEHMPDIQLFLRLLFTELLLAHPDIGVMVDVPHFVAFLMTKHEGTGGWFKTGSSQVKHTFSEMKSEGKNILIDGIKGHVGEIPYNIETHYALKTLSTGLNTDVITPTMLAILALAAVVEKEETCILEFDNSWAMQEKGEVKLPIRKSLKEKQQINQFILSEFYKYIKSSVCKDKKKAGDCDLLIKSIVLDARSIKILFDDKEYASGVAENILKMFSEMLQDLKPKYHNASTHLGQIIIWSGYHFCTTKCTVGCQREHQCTNQPYVALYPTDSGSELCISVGIPGITGSPH